MKIARNIGVIGAFITFIISPNTNLDPINLIKFFFLVVGAGYLIADYARVINRLKSGTALYRAFVLSVLSFIFMQTVSLFFSGASLVSQIYGAYGRNTGYLAYVALVILVLLVSTLEDSNEVREVIKWFLVIAVFEAIYGFIQFINIDPYSWKNLYNRIIGTLGNPNFSSAFYGVAASLIIPLIFQKGLKLWARLTYLSGVIVLLFLTLASNSWQGTGLILISSAIYFLSYVRTNSKIESFAYLLLGTYLVGATFITLGFQGKGPFGTYLNKPTFTIRMDYWRTAINMIKHHMLFGVGADNFGNWFRLMRDEETVKRIGLGISTNAAHNVVLDIMANTGIVSGVLYLVTVFLILWKSLTRLWMVKELDNNIFLPVFLAWLAYQIQSMVSINQIGLGNWGWIFHGIMAAIVLNDRNFEMKDSSASEMKKLRKIKKSLNEPLLTRFVATPIFILVAFLPLLADAKLASSLKSGDVNKVYSAVTSFPLDPSRLNFATQTFSQNKLPEYALKTAKYATLHFPENFDAWDLLSQVTNSQSDRDLALANKRRLDPYFEKYSQ